MPQHTYTASAAADAALVACCGAGSPCVAVRGFGTAVGGGPRRFFGKVDMQVGLGEVSLTNDLTLNEVAPSDWLIGYVQGNLNAGYSFVLFDGPPTVYLKPVVSAGGASFHFVKTKTQSGEMATAPSVNWDFLWSARAAIEFAL